MGILAGKKALVLGVANERSIAWGITRAFKEQGASVAMSYLNDKLKEKVTPLADEVGADFTFEMDVTNDDHYQAMVNTVKEKWGTFDILIHSLAFADRDDLTGTFVETSRSGFKLACDISAFSLIGLCNSLKELMNENGSVIAMTYHGSQQVVHGYNVMGVAKAALEASARYLADDMGAQKGIRVNCISAGPIRTLAASGVPGLRQIFKTVDEKAPLRRNVTTEDVGGTAAYLASDLSSGVTGQILYVDSGISTIACTS
jgi:enoyl-[acyl-carrier protein] reductase I